MSLQHRIFQVQQMYGESQLYVSVTTTACSHQYDVPGLYPLPYGNATSAHVQVYRPPGAGAVVLMMSKLN